MILSAAPLAIVIAAIVLLGVTGSLFSAVPLVIALQIGAVALSVWARRSFAPGTFRVTAAPGGSAIVRRGPYRYIRHPMYAAALLFVWTAVLSHLAALTLGIGVVVSVVVIARLVAEDRLLNRQLPGFAEYSRSTKALIPFVY